MIEDGSNPFHRTRRYAVPLHALPVKKKRRDKKKVGQGFTAGELAAIREIERERKPIPSFDTLVKEHHESV